MATTLELTESLQPWHLPTLLPHDSSQLLCGTSSPPPRNCLLHATASQHTPGSATLSFAPPLGATCSVSLCALLDLYVLSFLAFPWDLQAKSHSFLKSFRASETLSLLPLSFLLKVLQLLYAWWHLWYRNPPLGGVLPCYFFSPMATLFFFSHSCLTIPMEEFC